MKIVTDTHIHTIYSRCCTNPSQSVQWAAEHLAARGFKMIGITDHFWHNPAVEPLGWPAKHPLENILPQLDEIHTGSFPLKVLSSCEADMQGPGRIGITAEVKDKFDFVSIASDHFQLKYFVDQPREATPEKMTPLLLEFFRDAVCSGLADVLLHPLFTNGYLELFDATIASISDEQFSEVLSLAAAHNIGLEINCGVLTLAANGKFDISNMLRVFALAKQLGCKFTFGSDAHKAEDFELYSLAEEFANKLHLEVSDLHPLIRRFYL